MGILERVTGGMSFAVGGLWALEAGADVCGTSPVRIIGGWRRVEIAFWPDSKTALDQLVEEVSRAPPIE